MEGEDDEGWVVVLRRADGLKGGGAWLSWVRGLWAGGDSGEHDENDVEDVEAGELDQEEGGGGKGEPSGSGNEEGDIAEMPEPIEPGAKGGEYKIPPGLSALEARRFKRRQKKKRRKAILQAEIQEERRDSSGLGDGYVGDADDDDDAESAEASGMGGNDQFVVGDETVSGGAERGREVEAGVSEGADAAAALLDVSADVREGPDIAPDGDAGVASNVEVAKSGVSAGAKLEKKAESKGEVVGPGISTEAHGRGKAGAAGDAAVLGKSVARSRKKKGKNQEEGSGQGNSIDDSGISPG